MSSGNAEQWGTPKINKVSKTHLSISFRSKHKVIVFAEHVFYISEFSCLTDSSGPTGPKCYVTYL